MHVCMHVVCINNTFAPVNICQQQFSSCCRECQNKQHCISIDKIYINPISHNLVYPVSKKAHNRSYLDGTL